ncbi:protein serine/threonine phosphatase 2C [Guyanagaster necrorhizus]|uniref:Protein serine/threonine phosphatase 2C n=1 Tax=Guyanagaster necrorhizus TaxID=856835 RepID=A0A9P7VRD6_9AGAR|nr:protein serine/threonine phosphatase 2C [Guyanagaster necrorhizus MCA 3950]KAG7445315.1 protein serine/threonine phosphatase 2C [Guyanagaster necrorhizus MCA 3950]
MSSSTRSITHWRELFVSSCSSSITAGVHSVTFQPTPGARNEDRFVVQEWLIDGRRWKFLAVFDGHGGAHTSEYAAANLPQLIEEALRDVVEECQNRSRDTLVSKVKNVLRERIEEFDEEIGNAVKNLCSDPFTLNYLQAVALVNVNKPIFQRAFSGSTLSLALIDEEQENMWLAGLGDSTVVIACEDPDGIGHGEGLLTLHSTCTPKEYLSITMMHPSEEKETIMENGRLLGAVPYTRGLGDYGLKFASEFSTELFFKLPRGQRPQRYRDGIRYYNVTPPYVLNSPSTRFIDLTELRPHKSTLVLYTHGVDAIVNGETPDDQRMKKPDRPYPDVIVGRLVGSKVDDAFAQETLDHSVEVGWMGPDGNRAVELLGNLVAGTSAEMFAKFLEPAEHGQRDDMTILRYELVPRT